MVLIHEQSLRDGHQSLLATRMRTEDMLPLAELLDKVGFFSLESWGGATFDVCLRYLAEDPWERLRKLKEHVVDTPMQMLERGMNIVAYRNFPDDIVVKFIQLAYKNGVKYFRIFDALNDLRNLDVPIKTVKEVGGHAQGALSYTISPVHTVEYYIDIFKKLERMGCNSICLKDMAGICTPQRAYDIISACKKEGTKIPFDLHSHTTSGMALMSYMKACDAGADILDCSISPLAGGSSQPPTESVVAALQGTSYDTRYDLDLLIKCRNIAQEVWNKYKVLHNIESLKVDPFVLVHQIPGGMITNFIKQLEQWGSTDKLHDVLVETARVRKDLGWPPLVTPTSQIVGVQAVMNVVLGRYKQVTRETRDYVRGMYGKHPAEISPEIYRTILGEKWKDQIINCRPADLLSPMFKQCEDELKAKGFSPREEDIISYAIYPVQTETFLRGEAKPEVS